MSGLSPAVVATAIGGAVTLWPAVAAWKHRDSPGGRWFVAMVGLMAASAIGYTGALLVEDPFVRHLLEAGFWALALQVGILWAAFGLEYTGRGPLLRGPLGTVGAAAAIVGGVVVILDPIHGLVFPGFAVQTTGRVTFERGPGLFLLLAAIGVLIGAAWLLLFDTLSGEGSLFRRQTLALVVTPLFPMGAATLYVLDGGGTNLVPLSYAPHAALDLYALYSGRLFAVDPATRRLGERAALKTVDVPIVTVDTDGRVIAVNDAADTLFSTDADTVVGQPLADSLPASVTIFPDANTENADADTDGESSVLGADEAETVTIRTGGRPRQFRVRTAPFGDRGETLGYTVAFQDVTDVLARERRLSVLNRVLRHNMRNDLNVIVGHAELLADGVSDDHSRSATAVESRGRRLLSISERARELDEVVGSVDASDTVEVRSLIETVADELRGDHPAATVAIDVPDDLHLRTDRDVCRIVFANLLTNAVEHTGDEPTVTVRAVSPRAGDAGGRVEAADGGASVATDSPEGTDTSGGRPDHGEGVDSDHSRSGAASEGGVAVFEVTDDGPGIPDTEIAVLDEDTETALEHGSGLGLWVVQSGVTALGGEVSFETPEEGGTTVRLRIPGVVSDDA